MAATTTDKAPGAGFLAGSGVVFVLPLLAVMTIAFNAPILLMLSWSVAEPPFSLVHYREIFETTLYARVLWTTVRIALATTLISAVLGYPLALWIRGLSPRARIIALALVVLPFWVSILVRTYAWIVVLGNAGIVNRTLLALGLVGSPLSILYNEFGVLVGTVNVLLPYMVLPLVAAMARIDERLLHAAASLGAGERTIFRRVFFPLTLPAFAAGMILVFILTLGFYITPAVLGGGRVPMLSNMLDLLINQLPNWELAAAISTVLLVLVLCFNALSAALRERAA
jgi:ABC-type spermidine/putrescine transport system permease subunit I